MSGSKKRKSGISSIRSSVVTTLTKSDLPPDVRDRAIFEAREVLFSWIEGRSIDPELAPAIVVAVVAVVAPEIERPLQARIEELEKTLADNRKLWDESIAQTGAALERAESCYVEARAVVELRQSEKAALRAQLDQSQRIYAEFVTGQHEEALARVELLTAALTDAAEDLAYVAEHHPYISTNSLARARAALAAGVTEADG